MSGLKMILPDRHTPQPALASGTFAGFRASFGLNRNASAITQDVLTGGPFFVVDPTTVDQMALSVTAAAAGGKVLKILLYDSLPTTRYPGALLEASGNLAADGIAVVTYTIARTLEPYHLYYAYAWSDGAPTLEMSGGRGVLGMNAANDVGVGRPSPQRTLTFGTAPDPFGSVSSLGLNVPAVSFRVV